MPGRQVSGNLQYCASSDCQTAAVGTSTAGPSIHPVGTGGGAGRWLPRAYQGMSWNAKTPSLGNGGGAAPGRGIPSLKADGGNLLAPDPENCDPHVHRMCGGVVRWQGRDGFRETGNVRTKDYLWLISPPLPSHQGPMEYFRSYPSNRAVLSTRVQLAGARQSAQGPLLRLQCGGGIPVTE